MLLLLLDKNKMQKKERNKQILDFILKNSYENGHIFHRRVKDLMLISHK